MVEGIGNKPLQGGYGTAGIGGGANVGGTEKADKTQNKGLDGLLQTSEAKKKDTSAVTSTPPELTAPTGKTDTGEVASSIINTLGKLSADDAGKGLFVLYQLLVLLQKALNEMQQSTQLMRQAETNVAIANIQAEADTMKSAATFALWMGVISGIVQVGASAFSVVSGFKGVANTAKAKSTGEQLKTAQAQMTTLKTDMGTLKTEMGTLKTEMGTLKTELRGLQGAEPPNAEAIAAKQQQITAKQTEIDTKQTAIDTKQQQIDTKQDQIDAKQMEMIGLKTKMDMQLSTAQSYSNRGQAIGQLIAATGGFVKTVGDGIASGKQADAKAIEGQMKRMEEEASKTADLTKAIKDMLTAVLQLMQSVNKNEVDTTAQIFHGI